MTDQDKAVLIETEQRSKSNSHRLDEVEDEIREMRNEQKAIYSIATSVEVIAQRMTNIEEKVDETNQKVKETNQKVDATNQKVEAQSQAWLETEKRLTDKINEAENAPYKRTANNVNSVKIAIITAICTLLATGAIGAIITFAGK